MKMYKVILLAILLSIHVQYLVAQNNKEDEVYNIIYSDNFKADKGNWIPEFENSYTSSISIGKGQLDLNTSAGATVWCKEKFYGNIMITYDVTIVDSGGVNDRVSDLNAFWMASDPADKNIFTRDGKFSSYDNLSLYYAGVGGHDNETTRFRKYFQNGERPVIIEYLDKEHLLEGNKKYSVKITVQEGRTTYYLNNKLFFDYTDNKPLSEGYFGFRTTRSHQQFENFKVFTLPAVDNEYVRVFHNWAACTQAHIPDFGARVIVALTKVNIESSRGELNLNRGEIAVFLPDESYNAPSGEYFEVAFKLKHPPLKSPEQWLEPVKNKIVYEDEQFRVFEERLDPEDTRTLHSHAQRVVVRLNEVQLTDPRFHPNGTPGGGIQVPNTVRFAEPVVHVVKNLSKELALFNIVIEFKIPHK